MFRNKLLELTLKTLVLFSLSEGRAEAYKILAIFPTPSYSHQIVFRPVVDELASQGHQITIITPYPSASTHQNITQIDLGILKPLWNSFDFVAAADMPVLKFIQVFVQLMEDMFIAIFEHPDVKKLLRKEETFDGVLCEMLGYTPMYAFASHFKVPLMGITSMDLLPGHHRQMGNAMHPVLHPHFTLPFFGELNFFERCLAVYLDIFLRFFDNINAKRFDKIIQTYFDPSVGDSFSISKQMALAIANAHPALGNVRPIISNTVQVGFMHIKPPKLTSFEIKEYVGSREQGIIYVSFGSNVKSSNLNESKVAILLEAFSRIECYKVLWKWERPNFPSNSRNVFLFEWLPQTDIFATGMVKLFITQGGQQSMEEAIYYGVPMLVIPFFGDQEMNARRVETLGIGRRLSFSELNVNNVVEKATDILHNQQKYKMKVNELSRIVKDNLMPPVKLAAWWIEYTIRHNGSRHLRYPAVDMPTYKYYLLDVYLFTILVVVLPLSLIWLIFKWLNLNLVKKNIMRKLKIN